jgi:ubiquinone/menaquinone biosynthesis C-methylase UbiE
MIMSFQTQPMMQNSDYQKFENKRWSGQTQHIGFRHKVAAELLQKTKANSYLDIGCGDGAFEVYFQEFEPGAKVSGIDLSSVAVANAQIKVPNGHFCVADATGDGLLDKDDSYDVVLALDVLEHTFSPHVLLAEMKRVTKRHLIIGVPNFSSLPARLQMVMGRVPENNKPKKGHVYWFNYSVLTKMLKENDLTLLALRTNCQVERVPVIGVIMRILTNFFPAVFALSFVVLVEKKTDTLIRK